MSRPTQAELQARLDYDPKTGVFTWKMIPENRYRGKVAGHQNKRGYVSLFWNGTRLQAHQAAWCFVYGDYPPDLPDHKDGEPSNNAIENLREATPVQNAQNKRIQSNNKSGFKGVSFHKSRKKWRAAITVNGSTMDLGYFPTAADAHAAYIDASAIYFDKFARVA